MKASKIKLKLEIRKIDEQWTDDGIHTYRHYPITTIFTIMSNHYTADAPRIYITKIKGNLKSFKYKIIFEVDSNRQEAYSYLLNIFFTDELFSKAFHLVSLK